MVIFWLHTIDWWKCIFYAVKQLSDSIGKAINNCRAVSVRSSTVLFNLPQFTRGIWCWKKFLVRYLCQSCDFVKRMLSYHLFVSDVLHLHPKLVEKDDILIVDLETVGESTEYLWWSCNPFGTGRAFTLESF